MSRKVHFTESQVNEITERISENNMAGHGIITLGTADNFQNVSVSQAVDATKKIATANPSYNVMLDGNKIDTNTNPQITANKMIDNAKNMADGGLFENYTKKQIKEAKLRYLKEHSTAYSKKDFKNRFIKN